MNNNAKPGEGPPMSTVEPPEQAARVTPEAQIPPGQGPGTPPPPGTPTYQIYPQAQPQPPQTPYIQPVPEQPRSQGANPVLVTLLIVLGAIVILGVLFMVAISMLVSNVVRQVSNPPVGDLRTETQTVALDGASSVNAQLSIGVGKLDIAGGATDLMEATFTYNVDAWKPNVLYTVKDAEGTLLVQQPNNNSISTSPDTRYEWDLRFNNDVPMTMKVDMGVGEGNLRFGGLDLTRLEVNSGVGDTTVDLTGRWDRNLDVIVHGGVGQVTILVPQDTGVRIVAEGGLGSINASGFNVNGKTYTNDAYGNSPTTINIEVATGIGNINLVQGR